MNTKLVESLWGCGVRLMNGDDVVKEEGLVSCLELIMGTERRPRVLRLGPTR